MIATVGKGNATGYSVFSVTSGIHPDDAIRLLFCQHLTVVCLLQGKDND